MILAHKIRLYPNNKQAAYFSKACGVARYAYNWALEEWTRQYKAGLKPKVNELRKQLNAIKREQFPWMLEVTKCAPQLAIKDLGKAFNNFFHKRAEYPAYHKKGVNDSFSISNDQFTVRDKFIKIPNLGNVRMAEKLRFIGKIIGAAVSRKADKWFVAIQVELGDDIKKVDFLSENQAIGVDLGVKNLATLSDGNSQEGSKPIKRLEAKHRRMCKALSRKVGSQKDQKKSSNFIKARKKLSRLYYRIACIREDETHKLTSILAYNYAAIGIEDLNVKGMMSNHKLAKAVSDMSFFEFRRQLEYKANLTGSKVVVADRFFPSSKLCSCCGYKLEELKLSEREWECPNCHAKHDRDVNAAINLKNFALKKRM